MHLWPLHKAASQYQHFVLAPAGTHALITTLLIEETIGAIPEPFSSIALPMTSMATYSCASGVWALTPEGDTYMGFACRRPHASDQMLQHVAYKASQSKFRSRASACSQRSRVSSLACNFLNGRADEA